MWAMQRYGNFYIFTFLKWRPSSISILNLENSKFHALTESVVGLGATHHPAKFCCNRLSGLRKITFLKFNNF